MKHRLSLLSGLLLALSSVSYAEAATATGVLYVGLTVQSSCSINSTTNAPLTLTFPSAGSLTGGVTTNAPAVLNVTCSAGSGYTITLDGGANSDGTSRRLKCTACGTTPQYVPYTLSRTVGGSDLWAIGTAFSPTATGSGAAQGFQINATIPPISTPVTVGSYSDTVNITVTY